ncbi:unnamed protein product, partial [Rotaria sp. Silwood2]
NQFALYLKDYMKKGFVHCGYKIMPYSMDYCALLSNFEADQNYRSIDNLTVGIIKSADCT